MDAQSIWSEVHANAPSADSNVAPAVPAGAEHLAIPADFSGA
jgi:hypothetical protein